MKIICQRFHQTKIKCQTFCHTSLLIAVVLSDAEYFSEIMNWSTMQQKTAPD
jgi:hypothetical protein